jgi:parvulin-like peptidyl-prolyl isomerase
MTTWNFQLRLNCEPTEDEFDALYEAGLSDVGVEGTLVDVDRDAPTLLKAIASVAAQIRKVPGLRAVGVETDDAVTLADAAQRLGRRTAESLRLLAEGRRGPGGFPVAIVDTGKVRVYSWAEITAWLREALGEDVPAVNHDLVLADHALRLVDKAQRGGKADVEAVRHLVGTC